MKKILKTLLFVLLVVPMIGQTNNTTSSAEFSGWTAAYDQNNDEQGTLAAIPKCPVCKKRHRPWCPIPVPEPSVYGAIFVGTTLLGATIYRRIKRKS